MKRIIAMKAWSCDACGQEFPEKTPCYAGRLGRWVRVEGFRSPVHIYAWMRICIPCWEGNREH